MESLLVFLGNHVSLSDVLKDIGVVGPHEFEPLGLKLRDLGHLDLVEVLPRPLVPVQLPYTLSTR